MNERMMMLPYSEFVPVIGSAVNEIPAQFFVKIVDVDINGCIEQIYLGAPDIVEEIIEAYTFARVLCKEKKQFKLRLA